MYLDNYIQQAGKKESFLLFSLKSVLVETLEILNRGGSRTAATSKVEFFVIIVNRWKQLIIIIKS